MDWAAKLRSESPAPRGALGFSREEERQVVAKLQQQAKKGRIDAIMALASIQRNYYLAAALEELEAITRNTGWTAELLAAEFGEGDFEDEDPSDGEEDDDPYADDYDNYAGYIGRN